MFWVKVNLSVDLVKSGQLTNIVDSVSTTNQQNLSTIKNVDLRKSHPHQQNWSIAQIVDSLLDPNQQMVSLKIGETTKCTLGFFLHNNKFVDQQSGSNVQIVVSGPTSTNCVIPNLPRGSRQLYHALLAHFFRENNLRTPSAKFLCVKFCRPESFDFLCLCHQYNILIVSEMSPIGPNCREESVCFGFGVELHYNELGWVSQKWSADQNSSSSIFRETKIFSTAKRCSYNSPTQRSQPNPIPLPIQSHL